MSADHSLAPASSDTFSHAEVTALPGGGGAAGSRWAIVAARFNGAITEALFEGAVDALIGAGGHADRIHAVSVPGAMEIPLAAGELAETSHYAGIVALGCVIRGETAHFDYVCSTVADGLLRVQLDHRIPVGFGVLTVETLEQAKARAQRDGGRNAGAEAAQAAIELAAHVRMIRSS